VSEEVVNPFAKNVFIDTSVFRKYNFDFEHKSIKRLIELSSIGVINLFITDIIYNEVIANIKADVILACKKISVSDASILKNIDEFKKLLDPESITDKLMTNYKKFIMSASIVILPTNPMVSKIVIDNYFNAKPPFGVKKKDEFPDSFILETVLSWCKDKGENAYLISTDPDWKVFCENNKNLEIKENFEEIINLFLRQEKDLKQLILFTDKLIEDNKDLILIDIKDSISKIPSYRYDIDYGLSPKEHYCDAPGYEIANIDVIDIVDFIEIELVEISKNSAIYNIIAETLLNVEYYLEDYSYASYDKEDDKWFNVETDEPVKTHRVNINVELEILYSYDDSDSFDIKFITPQDKIELAFYKDE